MVSLNRLHPFTGLGELALTHDVVLRLETRGCTRPPAGGLGILAGFLLGVMADLLCQLLQELFHRGFVGHFRGVARDKELIR